MLRYDSVFLKHEGLITMTLPHFFLLYAENVGNVAFFFLNFEVVYIIVMTNTEYILYFMY